MRAKSVRERGFRGVFIPAEVWCDENLKPGEMVLMMEIDSLDRGEGCYASKRYLSEFMGITERRVQKMISRLIRDGYLEQVKFDGRKRWLKIRGEGKFSSGEKESSPLPFSTSIEKKRIEGFFTQDKPVAGDHTNPSQRRQREHAAAARRVYDECRELLKERGKKDATRAQAEKWLTRHIAAGHRPEDLVGAFKAGLRNWYVTYMADFDNEAYDSEFEAAEAHDRLELSNIKYFGTIGNFFSEAKEEKRWRGGLELYLERKKEAKEERRRARNQKRDD